MKLDREEFRLHATWAVPALVVLLVATCWYGIASWRDRQFLGGGSGVGLACGLAAALIIVFDMLLWPRKLLRRWRLGPARHWMAAHIWFGLVCLPLAVLHSGLHWGGWLPTILIGLLALVVISGVYGLCIQNVLPRWMLLHVPAETIVSQIGHVSRQAADDLRRLLMTACGPSRSAGGTNQPLDELVEELSDAARPAAVVIGAVREVGRFRGRTLRTATVTAHRDDRRTLWNAFAELEPFLRDGSAAGGPVADPLRAQKWFELLRRTCHEDSAGVIDALEQQCDQRRQLDTQRRLHGWLHGWIPWHLALSLMLTLLLFAHTWTALRYR